jgi:hypothetical protein
LLNRTPSTVEKLGLFSSTVYVFKALQRLKAPSPIDVTDDGMVMDVKDEQPRKAPSPIDVTDEGMISEVKAEH